MDNATIVIAIVFFSGHIFFSIKLIRAAKKRGLNFWNWLVFCIIGGIFPLISMVLIYLLYAIVIGIKEKKQQDKPDKSLKNVIIPNTCPHCKNPNTKKLQDCEWCGSKIC